MAMESEKSLQDFRYSDSDKRKKLDGFTMFEIGGAKDIKDTNIIGKRDMESLESQPKYDLRKSLAWDTAFFTSSGFLEPEELSHTLNSWDNQNDCGILGHDQHQLLPALSLEPEMKNRIDECNLRKSLAWDTAFLTSEGVLNHEELSVVNTGFKKSEMRLLLGIEELWMSSESNCTIDSDGSSLASLEVELFEDIRTYMHQSSKASTAGASSSRQGRVRDMQKIHAPNKMDGSGELKVKSLPTSRRQAINGNQPEGATKEGSTPPSRQHSGGSRESDSSLSLKPPKISGRGRSIPMAPTERFSLAANEVKGGNKTIQATNGKSSTVSTKLNPGKSISDILSSTFPSKSSSLSNPDHTIESRVFCSPCTQFSIGKSSLNSSESKSESPNVSSLACISTLAPPSGYILPESCHPTYSSSVTKKCPCTSPSVSIDSCSSKSSTSTNLRCLDSVTSDTFRQFSNASTPSNLERQQRYQTNVAYHGKGSKLLKEKGSHSVPFAASRYIKPSGLRMPSPKIGFFDVDDSLVQVENEDWKSPTGVPNSASNVGNGNRNSNGYANRSKKLQTSGILKDRRSTKICTQQIKQFTMSGRAKSTLVFAPVSKAGSDLNCEEKSKDSLRDEKAADVGEHEAEFGVESCVKMERKGAPESMGHKLATEKEGLCLIGKRVLQRDYNRAKTSYTHMVQDDEKENLIGFQNQLEGLHAQVKTIDVNGDAVIELSTRNGPLEDD